MWLAGLDWRLGWGRAGLAGWVGGAGLSGLDVGLAVCWALAWAGPAGWAGRPWLAAGLCAGLRTGPGAGGLQVANYLLG